MGSCLSKKNACSSSPPPPALPDPPEKLKSETQSEKKKETAVKKEIFIIKHRTSHELDRRRLEEEKVEIGENATTSNGGGGIQCGHLNRSSSAGKALFSSGRRVSGSKRSYDFDSEKRRYDDDFNADGDDEATERENRRRERRRTPSRERDGSRERGGGGGRRVSRSPGRRSESPITAHSNSSAANGSCRPGKMISVPATVAVNRSSNSGSGGGGVEAGVKRIQVMRNVGSPRAMSPARLRAANNSNQNLQQPISLSRSNSRKAGVSPCRRIPLNEIHTNIISQKQNAANETENRNTATNNNCTKQERHPVRSNVVPESLKTTRILSSRQSCGLDVDPEAPSTPNTSSYTALLLEDIHNFHQKNTTCVTPFSVPLCVTKARSIVEAVADLNSTTASNDFRRNPNHIKSHDLMQPSFNKYVTVRRGTDDLESSGSNSFAGRQQQWTSSSSSYWESHSAESNDGRSRSISRQNEGGKKRGADNEQSGSRVLHMKPASAVALGMKMDA